MKQKLSGTFAILMLCLPVTRAQSPLHITFDGPPILPPGSASLVQRYDEGGMTFTPIGLTGFVRQGGSVAFYPENGTTYLQALLGSDLRFRFINLTTFDLISVDLAEYSTVVPDAVTVHFIGYRLDGSMVTQDFTTDGIIDGTGPIQDFQTFHFGPEFSNLTRVEVPTFGWSMDNLVVVPEPSTFALLIAGTPILWALRRRRRTNQVRTTGQCSGRKRIAERCQRVAGG